MKRKLNEQLSLKSAALMASLCMLLILTSAAIARACGPAQTNGCDVGCAVQYVNDCINPSSHSCVLRSCEYNDGCEQCEPGPCERTCRTPPAYHPCGGCVANPLGCSGLSECCVVG